MGAAQSFLFSRANKRKREEEITVLNDDVLGEIFVRLDFPSLLAAMRTCKRLYGVGRRVIERWENRGFPVSTRWMRGEEASSSIFPFGDNLALGQCGRITLLNCWGHYQRTVDFESRSWVWSMAEFDGRLASGLSCGTILIWDSDGERHGTLDSDEGGVASLVAIGDLLASGHRSGAIRLWDKGRKCVDTLRRHADTVTAMVNFEGLLASGSRDRTIRLSDVNSGDCVRTLRGHAQGVSCLKVFGERLVSGSRDASIRWWTRSGECAKVLELPNHAPSNLACSEYLLFSICKHEIRIYDTEGKLLRTMPNRDSHFLKMLCFWRGCLVTSVGDYVTMWHGKRG